MRVLLVHPHYCSDSSAQTRLFLYSSVSSFSPNHELEAGLDQTAERGTIFVAARDRTLPFNPSQKALISVLARAILLISFVRIPSCAAAHCALCPRRQSPTPKYSQSSSCINCSPSDQPIGSTACCHTDDRSPGDTRNRYSTSFHRNRRNPIERSPPHTDRRKSRGACASVETEA
jgi:hypothetical protein